MKDQMDGRMHSSVGCVVSSESLDHVVPPALHIMMGNVEKIYHILVERCNDFDDDEDSSVKNDGDDPSDSGEEDGDGCKRHGGGDRGHCLKYGGDDGDS